MLVATEAEPEAPCKFSRVSCRGTCTTVVASLLACTDHARVDGAALVVVFAVPKVAVTAGLLDPAELALAGHNNIGVFPFQFPTSTKSASATSAIVRDSRSFSLSLALRFELSVLLACSNLASLTVE